MPGPKEFEERLQRILEAWRRLAPDKSFGGMTLAQFEALAAPSLNARRRISELEDELTREQTNRDHADDTLAPKLQQVIDGVRADPTEGPDSALIEAMGYTRKSERKTGLTRKRKGKETPPTK